MAKRQSTSGIVTFLLLGMLVTSFSVYAQSMDQLVPKPKAQQEVEQKKRVEEERFKLGMAIRETENLIKAAEVKRAKLLRNENRKEGGFLLVWAIPQPSEEEIAGFLVPLKRCLKDLTNPRVREQVAKQIKYLPKGFGFEGGKFRAVYVLIPSDPKAIAIGSPHKVEPVTGGSFAAETEAECDAIIRQEMIPVKLEVGKSYTAREGVRTSVYAIDNSWRYSELVKGTGREEHLRKWQMKR